MDLGLTGKRALVTGSTVGIGFAIAERLAREGAVVVLHGRAQAKVESSAERLRAAVPGAAVEVVAADLEAPEGTDHIARAVPDVDILVNNAGIFWPKAFEELTREDWTRIFEVNVFAAARLAAHYFPKMLARNAGRIVFISSESAQQIPVEMIHYGVSKTAMAALARGLAERTRKTNVTVNSVLAGPTKSEGVADFVRALGEREGKTESEAEADFFVSARPTSILQRFASPAEIADVVAFVVSERAAVINGAAVRAEGGLLKTTF